MDIWCQEPSDYCIFPWITNTPKKKLVFNFKEASQKTEFLGMHTLTQQPNLQKYAQYS